MTAGNGAITERIAVVGVLNDELRVEQITGTVRQLLGREPAECLGTIALRAVHPQDVSASLLGLAHALEAGACADLGIRLRRRDRRWVHVRLVLGPFTSPRPFRIGFLAVPSGTHDEELTGQEARLATLEAVVRRIGLEIHAAGATMSPAAGLQLAGFHLTRRELEVVELLANGQRSPAIAKALFVSQSTVRNHLCSIYRKLAVHSQTELLAALRPPSPRPPVEPPRSARS